MEVEGSTIHYVHTVSEASLVAAALALGARSVQGWSHQEEKLARGLPELPATAVTDLKAQIEQGHDPLGDQFCALRPPATRRILGATYTPPPIIDAMLRWAAKQPEAPERVVDPGVGSARFLLRAHQAFPNAKLVGIEVDPLAALIARANLSAAGLGRKSSVLLRDYRALELPVVQGRTLYIGNPPYVRHHLLETKWKDWLLGEAAKLSCRASGLAGLHVYFFLATAARARTGDFGAFVTAAEWLDVNYGCLVRDLFLGRLGGSGVTVIEPTAMPFPDAATTAAITVFEIGSRPSSISFRRVAQMKQLRSLSDGKEVRRERVEAEQRWSHLTRVRPQMPEGYIELGEFFRVHRGQVTGANRIWIAGEHSAALPSSVLFASVTKARELLGAGAALANDSHLRRVIDLPVDLSVFEGETKRAVEAFLKSAAAAGADKGYIARNRRAWWAVGLREPAPLLATYMARRPPAFVRNLVGARHLNIAHGLYPRSPLDPALLDALARYLSSSVTTAAGRTYAGGLTKFEPREMERLPVPAPDTLEALAAL